MWLLCLDPPKASHPEQTKAYMIRPHYLSPLLFAQSSPAILAFWLFHKRSDHPPQSIYISLFGWTTALTGNNVAYSLTLFRC